jgi:DNA repair exonuclease SbcCD ATPase subunit
MSGIPSMLIDEAIPFMNRRIMEYLDAIGGRYIVSFDTLGEIKSGEVRDKITIRVLDTVTKANMRKQLSGGQTRIVDIATILTLSDLQNIIQDTKTNIILLDEIFDSLDDKNIAYVSNLLRSLAKGRSTNIISHRAIDQIDCDEQLQLF